MKKLIFLTTTIFLSFFTQAQVVPGFNIGPKIGATFSKFSTDENQINEEIKNTFHFGAFARLGKKVYFQPELVIMSRRGMLKDVNLIGSSSSIKINTIDIPLLLGVKVIDVKAANVRVMAGPVASLAINKTVDNHDWDEAITNDDIRSANWGLQFGAGVDLLVFTIDLRYELGMNDYSKLENFDLKNNMFLVSLGWKIL